MASRNTDQTSTRPLPLDLPPAELLWVPSDLLAGEDPPDWVAPGTQVTLGQSLHRGTSQTYATPIAPAAGVVGPATVVGVVGGARVHAVELRPHAVTTTPVAASLDATPYASAATSAAARLASITPADLAGWLTRIQAAGIWANRWTCPNLLGQLRGALSRPVDTLICNLLASDPWLPLARVVAGAWPLELAAGLGLLGRLSGAANWWALTDQADDTAGPLRDAAASVAGKLRIAPVENDYPQLDPSLLVKATTGRRLRPGRLPTSLGVLLVDAQAAVAIGRLVLAGPHDVAGMTRLPLIVYDQAGDAIYGFTVAPGTSVGEIARHIALPSAVREIYAGGPLRQIRVTDEEVIGGGELTLFAAPPQPAIPASPCVRCGWCIEVCPTRCRPAGLLQAAQLQDADLAHHNGLDACIECGLCTFICPSRLPLLEGIRQIRREIAADGL